MKKLLSLIGTVSIIGAGVNTVISCNDNISADQQAANDIKNKITNPNLTVPLGSTNPDTANPATITAIKKALQTANSALTSDDLAKIIFSITTLQAEVPISVTATITVGSAIATKDLKVTLAQTDQQKVDAIKDKITKVDLTVPAGTNPDTTNAGTIAAIKKALRAANPTLTNDDLAKITFASVTLQDNTPVMVQATITVGIATAQKDLNVTLDQTDQQKADAIKDKITNVNLTVVGVPVDTQNEGTIKAIKTSLKNANPNLTDDDLAKISFNNVTLKIGESVIVKATITVGEGIAEKNLNVTLAQTDQQKADAIKGKIVAKDLNLPVGTSTDVSQDKQALDKALQAANPTLTTQDLATIKYSGPALIPGTAVNVTATITVGTAKDTVDLSVTLDKKTPPPPPSGKVLSGYWYGWKDPVAISDINPLYNLIDIAFYNTPSSSSSLPALDPSIINNEAAVKAGIKQQQAAGHKVVLSLGGAIDFTAINAGNVKQFESNTLTIMKNYGFNGIDIDLEGEPARDQSNAQYIPEALKYLKTELGSSFIITAAPEFPNLRTGPSIYPTLLTSLGSDLTYLQPQIYNQGGDGINVSSSDQAKFGVPSYLAQNNTQFHAQFLYLIMKYLSTTDPSDPNFAVKVDPAKLLIGLPATTSAAGSGYTEPAVVQQAYKIFQQQKLNISGLMTWAVNYDHNNNWQFALESYGKTWGS